MTNKRHHGSSLDSLLTEDGLLEEAHAEATKKVIDVRIAQSRQDPLTAQNEANRREALRELAALDQELGLR